MNTFENMIENEVVQDVVETVVEVRPNSSIMRNLGKYGAIAIAGVIIWEGSKRVKAKISERKKSKDIVVNLDEANDFADQDIE